MQYDDVRGFQKVNEVMAELERARQPLSVIDVNQVMADLERAQQPLSAVLEAPRVGNVVSKVQHDMHSARDIIEASRVSNVLDQVYRDMRTAGMHLRGGSSPRRRSGSAPRTEPEASSTTTLAPIDPPALPELPSWATFRDNLMTAIYVLKRFMDHAWVKPFIIAFASWAVTEYFRRTFLGG